MKYQEAMTILKEFEALCVKYESIYFYIGFIQSNLARLMENKDAVHSIHVIQKAIEDMKKSEYADQVERLQQRCEEIDMMQEIGKTLSNIPSSGYEFLKNTKQ